MHKGEFFGDFKRNEKNSPCASIIFELLHLFSISPLRSALKGVILIYDNIID